MTRLELEADLDQWWAKRTLMEKLSAHARIALGCRYDLVEEGPVDHEVAEPVWRRANRHESAGWYADCQCGWRSAPCPAPEVARMAGAGHQASIVLLTPPS